MLLALRNLGFQKRSLRKKQIQQKQGTQWGNFLWHCGWWWRFLHESQQTVQTMSNSAGRGLSNSAESVASCSHPSCGKSSRLRAFRGRGRQRAWRGKLCCETRYVNKFKCSWAPNHTVKPCQTLPARLSEPLPNSHPSCSCQDLHGIWGRWVAVGFLPWWLAGHLARPQLQWRQEQPLPSTLVMPLLSAISAPFGPQPSPWQYSWPPPSEPSRESSWAATTNHAPTVSVSHILQVRKSKSKRLCCHCFKTWLTCRNCKKTLAITYHTWCPRRTRNGKTLFQVKGIAWGKSSALLSTIMSPKISMLKVCEPQDKRWRLKISTCKVEIFNLVCFTFKGKEVENFNLQGWNFQPPRLQQQSNSIFPGMAQTASKLRSDDRSSGQNL